MREALIVAADGLERGELPIGAVVVLDHQVVSSAYTQERAQRRLLVHAELLALDAAMSAMIGTVVFALPSPGDGAADFAHQWDHRRRKGAIPGYRVPIIRGGVLGIESRMLFEQYVARSGDVGPMVAWARTLIT